MNNSQDLVILFGGPSSERLVSVASAQHIAQVLPEARCWFWSPEGSVHEVARETLLGHERPFECAFEPKGAASWRGCEAAFDACGKNTVFVLALHGVGGEDGQVQGWLEKRRLCFTGSGAEASHRAFDKSAAKRLVAKQGVRIADSEQVSGRDLAGAGRALTRLRERSGRAVMKPVADGSSHGVCFVDETPASLERALDVLREAPGTIYLGEAFVEGTELTVGVYDGPDGLRALPPSEVRLEKGRSFDYAGKYLGHGTIEITPAEISASVRDAAQKVALAAHQAVGCLGYSRTDMIVDASGPVFLEINNLPGVTRASFIPQQLAVAKISMKDFLARQIELAKKRY